MYAKFCVNRETANNFMRLLVNRRAYAVQAERPLPNGSVPYYPARDWKTKAPKPLDEGVVRMHLNGDVFESLDALINAEIFVMAKSSFSYTAALLSRGIVIYNQFWHASLQRWTGAEHVRHADRARAVGRDRLAT